MVLIPSDVWFQRACWSCSCSCSGQQRCWSGGSRRAGDDRARCCPQQRHGPPAAGAGSTATAATHQSSAAGAVAAPTLQAQPAPSATTAAHAKQLAAGANHPPQPQGNAKRNDKLVQYIPDTHAHCIFICPLRPGCVQLSYRSCLYVSMMLWCVWCILVNFEMDQFASTFLLWGRNVVKTLKHGWYDSDVALFKLVIAPWFV